MPNQFDVIISNPPWLWAKPAGKTIFEVGNYDPNGEMIFALMNFVSEHLRARRMGSLGGIFYLMYSDYSENIGLAPKGVIPALCDNFDLEIRGKAGLIFFEK